MKPPSLFALSSLLLFADDVARAVRFRATGRPRPRDHELARRADAIGNTSAQAYDLNGYGADTTHLNAYGSIVFGRLVADLLLEKLPELDSWFTPNETLSYDLANGIAA